MKEKIKELFKHGWIGLVVATVITILLMNEEKSLGDMSGSYGNMIRGVAAKYSSANLESTVCHVDNADNV